ncbi:MAG TPA: hypothetical protein VJW94_02505 [Candidatus Acidoferrum sp.]|nr:hypothetical protein [Candidatus Acidoferrum sp.]
MLPYSYSYLERRYSRKTRLQVFLLATGMTAALVGAIAAVELSETPEERNARVESEFRTDQITDRKNLMEQQQYYLSRSCEQGKAACDRAVAIIREQNCRLYGEGCKGRGTNLQSPSFMDELDRKVQERLRDMP